MRSIAVIPVKGRLPLLKVTLNRLYDKNGIGHIICVGDTEEERNLCNSCGAEFVQHENKPLGRKWNAGFLKAREHNPDFVVYVGSSDWLSDNWLPEMLPLADKHYMVGKFDFYMLHFSHTWFTKKRTAKLSLWPHYSDKSHRRYEPIGIGRILNRDFLNAIGWQPFFDDLNKGMDGAMWWRLGEVQRNTSTPLNMIDDKFKCCIYPRNGVDKIRSLSISCDKWTNMHRSDFRQRQVTKVQYPESWLTQWFPEALKLEL